MTGLFAVVVVVALMVSGAMAARQIRRVDGPALKAWLARARAEYRAERDQPDAGLSITGCRSRSPLTRRKATFVEHVADALDVFTDPEAELLEAGQQIQATDPQDLMTRFYEETSR